MSEIRKLQKVLLEILIEIAKICEKNKLEYWLDSGTLLGAIRHKGFIPWDDDIDIVMPREDYEKFIDLVLNSKIVLSENLEIDYYKTESAISPWIKIRDKNSCFKEVGQRPAGIFIDIFPVDFLDIQVEKNFYEDKLKYKKLYKILRNREFILEKPLIKNARYNILWMARGIVSKIIGKYRENIYMELKGLLYKYEVKGLKEKTLVEYGIEIPWFNLGILYDKIYPLKKERFEGYEFNVPKDYNAYLIKLYGEDYMIIPKKENQIVHNLEFKIFDNGSKVK